MHIGAHRTATTVFQNDLRTDADARAGHRIKARRLPYTGKVLLAGLPRGHHECSARPPATAQSP